MIVLLLQVSFGKQKGVNEDTQGVLLFLIMLDTSVVFSLVKNPSLSLRISARGKQNVSCLSYPDFPSSAVKRDGREINRVLSTGLRLRKSASFCENMREKGFFLFGNRQILQIALLHTSLKTFDKT